VPGAAHLATRYDLDGRVALVTGASGLLGGAVCRDLAACGATVVAGYTAAVPSLRSSW